MISFSRVGIPIFEQSAPPFAALQAGEFTCSGVKMRLMLLIGTPRSDENWNVVWSTPTAARPRPSVCARSAKIGPDDRDVFTGTPPSNRNVTPPDVVAMGTLPM